MRLLSVVFTVAWALAAHRAAAHPLHSSLAEADYHRATQRLEVAVRVFADDFEHALTTRAGKKISLEKTPAAEIDALTQRYLQAAFTLKTRAGTTPAPLTWIGRELKDATNELWLYFEISLPGGIEGVRLKHALLADMFSDQLNSVRVRDGPRKTTLLFLPGQGEQTVQFPRG